MRLAKKLIPAKAARSEELTSGTDVIDSLAPTKVVFRLVCGAPTNRLKSIAKRSIAVILERVTEPPSKLP